MAPSRVCKRLIISGVVQGVGFRYSMVEACHRLGVTGWVRNLRDGRVEAVVQGDAEQVESIIAWSKQGPSMASVSNVEILEAAGNFEEFSISNTIS